MFINNLGTSKFIFTKRPILKSNQTSSYLLKKTSFIIIGNKSLLIAKQLC